MASTDAEGVPRRTPIAPTPGRPRTGDTQATLRWPECPLVLSGNSLYALVFGEGGLNLLVLAGVCFRGLSLPWADSQAQQTKAL